MSERLYRSVDDRMIGGVCGGVAARLHVDPSIVRVVWALLILPTGLIALAAYVVMWLVVPEAPTGVVTQPLAPMRHPHPTSRDGFTLVVGGALVLVGAWFLLRDMFPVLDPGRLWPVALVLLGIGVVVWALQRSRNDSWSHRP
jgi:phage shock protein PspC (stress-responsive transcriptional regulator)